MSSYAADGEPVGKKTKTSGGGVLDPALFGDARCAALRAAYAVVPGVSWGTAPAEAQTEWRTRGCDGMG